MSKKKTIGHSILTYFIRGLVFLIVTTLISVAFLMVFGVSIVLTNLMSGFQIALIPVLILYLIVTILVNGFVATHVAKIMK